uniref:protein-methionine-sulfoxide reductase heme-binding subunit MsrQ n=1 Tax=Halomonas sp. TaxID=1486246 RepID=UPI002611F42D|nr:protein-methionine-sulfoxide reductase heme-binding subunit MsrQ [Halomonas sp.]
MARLLPDGMARRINKSLRRVPAGIGYLLCLLPFLWLTWLTFSGGLGADPVKEIEHRLGEAGLQLLVIVLAITPLRLWTGIILARFRRAIALMGFYYIVAHLAAWLVLDMGLLWSQAVEDIFKRPYITIGMAALILMIPLALTSNDRAVRRLGGKRWLKLHRLTYIAVLLGGLHYVWLVRTWEAEPLIYMAVIVMLLAARVPWQRYMTRSTSVGREAATVRR